MSEGYVVEVDPLAALRDYQAGRCALCNERRKRLLVDHDHVTGLVRGLLCNGCNTSEGRDHRAPWFVRYREDPPAARLGLRVQYRDRRPVSYEAESLLGEVRELISEAGWEVGGLGKAWGDVAFNIYGPDKVQDCVSLWATGPHTGQYTWGNSGNLDEHDQVLNNRFQLSASTPAERVARLVLWTMDIERDAHRLSQLLGEEWDDVQRKTWPYSSISIDDEVAVVNFRSDWMEHEHFLRVLTPSSDTYFFKGSGAYSPETGRGVAVDLSLTVDADTSLERVAAWTHEVSRPDHRAAIERERKRDEEEERFREELLWAGRQSLGDEEPRASQPVPHTRPRDDERTA